MTDIAVIGGGPAGLTAALYAARAGKSVTVYERECIGGQITRAPQVENYPGAENISGLQLGDRMAAQAEAAGAEISLTDVQKIAKESSGIFRLDTDDGEYYAKAVIYACGARPKTLGLPGEAELVGHGVSYCALCDGSFFRGKDVAVVGGGNSAFDDVLLLSERCRHVTLIHRRSSFRAEQILVERVKQRNNISFLTDTTVSELIQENGQLTALMLKSKIEKNETLSASGLFVALGRLPDTQLLIGLAPLDENGYVFTDEKTVIPETPGLFAAGDCREKSVRQLTTAVSDALLFIGIVFYIKAHADAAGSLRKAHFVCLDTEGHTRILSAVKPHKISKNKLAVLPFSRRPLIKGSAGPEYSLIPYHLAVLHIGKGFGNIYMYIL